MTDLRQAAQQALQALEGWEHCDKWVWPVTALEQAKQNTTESLAALRTALEQQQAEPVASRWIGCGECDCTFKCYSGGQECIRLPIKQAEPVAYFDFQELKFSWAKHMKIGPVPVSIKVEPMKLYSEPTKRQWVGLTKVQQDDFADAHGSYEVVCAIEAKLKERNT